MKKTNFNKRAFTLVELLVVIAIIAILFVVLISKVDFATDKAKESGVQTDFRSFQMAMHTVGIEYQGYPENIDELANLLNKNLDRELEVVVEGSELKSNAKDPWGTEYKLTYARPEGTRGEITVHSAGPDMQFHTGDDLKTTVKYALTENGADIIITGNTGVNVGNGTEDNTNNGGSQEPVEYEMLDTVNAPVTGYTDLTFRSAADYSKFEAVKVNDEVIDSSCYTVSSGSTVVTLKKAYVATLNNGNHILEIVSNDGVASTSFTMDVVTPTIDLLPGMYAAGTLQSYANQTINYVEASQAMIKSWDELVSGNVIKVTGTEMTSYNDSLAGDLVVPDTIQSIGSWFACWTYNLNGIFLPSTITNIEDGFLEECWNIDTILVDQNNTSYVSINNTLYNFDKTTLIAHAHKDPSTDFVVPDSVTKIGVGAFGASANLINIYLGKNITEFCEMAFYHVDNLTNVYISDLNAYLHADMSYQTSSPTSWGAHLFVNKEEITSIIIPETITHIDNHFTGWRYLQSISIPDTVTSISTWAFDNCSGLTEITIPGSISSISEYAFSNCQNLKTIVFEEGVTTIGNYAFNVYNGSPLTSIIIPKSVTYIGKQVLKPLTRSTYIYYGGSTGEWQAISKGSENSTSAIFVFYSEDAPKTEGLYWHYVDDIVTMWPEYSGPQYTINNGTVTITGWVGDKGDNLIIPSEIEGCPVTSIADGAFYWNGGFTTLTIPNSVIYIGEAAFENCTTLSTIYYAGTEAQWNSITFGNGVFAYCDSLTNFVYQSE